jgi:hypothetical protein
MARKLASSIRRDLRFGSVLGSWLLSIVNFHASCQELIQLSPPFSFPNPSVLVRLDRFCPTPSVILPAYENDSALKDKINNTATLGIALINTLL